MGKLLVILSYVLLKRRSQVTRGQGHRDAKDILSRVEENLNPRRLHALYCTPYKVIISQSFISDAIANQSLNLAGAFIVSHTRV
ncbi:hypothetical protein VNO77_25412 [Canavalia gladiata]|uniref:Uncharacterized protein n=1 Tax=Canavalia gladiata TaxID=3824 RepID=A0AAN9LBG3_CANGL